MEEDKDLKELISFSEFKNLIVGEETFPVVIKNGDNVVKIIMRCLNTDDLALINKILAERGIDFSNIPIYNDALRLLKLTYCITKIIINDKQEVNVSDKLKFEEALKTMPEQVLKALQLQYDVYNANIYNKFEKKTN
jgi:hypothetical protein